MRDAFLIFLMTIAGMLVAGYIWLLVAVVKSDDDESGCLLIWAAIVVIAIVGAILATVGHAVGVNVSSLTGKS